MTPWADILKRNACWEKYTAIGALLVSFTAHGEVVTAKNAMNGLNSWEMNEHSLRLELVQRYPSQTAAFFIARGFSEPVASDLAKTGCVFQTIGKNIGKTADVSINLADWRVVSPDHTQPVKLKKQWDAQWPKDAVTPAARIAFRWATFPTEQTFKPGDYNWGMTTFGLPPGAVFDLKVVWREGDQAFSNIIPKLQCAEDPA